MSLLVCLLIDTDINPYIIGDYSLNTNAERLKRTIRNRKRKKEGEERRKEKKRKKIDSIY